MAPASPPVPQLYVANNVLDNDAYPPDKFIPIVIPNYKNGLRQERVPLLTTSTAYMVTPESEHYHHGHHGHHGHHQPYEYHNDRLVPFKAAINIRTRGEVAAYQVGVLSDGSGSVYPIFGRPTYPGSSKWNYYTATNDAYPLKLPVTNKSRDCGDEVGCDEIYDGDTTVRVRTFPDKQYKATIYAPESPRYIPYV